MLNTSHCCWATPPICFQQPASAQSSRHGGAAAKVCVRTRSMSWSFSCHWLRPGQRREGQAASSAAAAASVRTSLSAGDLEQRCCSRRKPSKSQGSESVDGVAPQINEGERAASRIRMWRRLALKRHLWHAEAALSMSDTAFHWEIFLLLHPFGSPGILHGEPPLYGTTGLRSRALHGFKDKYSYIMRWADIPGPRACWGPCLCGWLGSNLHVHRGSPPLALLHTLWPSTLVTVWILTLLHFFKGKKKIWKRVGQLP